jgi:hypothetical protein
MKAPLYFYRNTLWDILVGVLGDKELSFFLNKQHMQQLLHSRGPFSAGSRIIFFILEPEPH